MTRNITVYLERDQKKVYFENVDINTLGELKALLTENNINYTDMDFNEGVSGVKLLNNDSQLPHDLTFKGQRTNDLMILLTTTAKKTASGADRRELYEKIKEYGLFDVIHNKYHKNFTNLPTIDLAVIVEEYEDSHCAASTSPAGLGNVERAIFHLLEILFNNGTIDDDDYDSVLGEFNNPPKKEEPEKGYTQEEIDKALEGTK